MSAVRRVMVVAGEASGDQHAAGLIREAHRLDPALSFFGVGGDCLRRAGAQIVHEARTLSIVGISEVFAQLPTVLAILRDLRARLRRESPAALLLIDLPDFNLALAKTAHSLGIPVVYFISPQVWAWRHGRVRTIRKRVDRMIVFFPFEAEFYRMHQVPVTLAGHPLAEHGGRSTSPSDARHRLGLDPDRPTFGLLPGSRRGEIRRLIDPMFATAREVLSREPAAQFVMPVAQTLDSADLQGAAVRSGLPVVAMANAFDLMVDACDAAICASGTATLELAAHDVPAVVVYKTSLLTYAIARLVVDVPHISLVNLLAGERLLPELIQSDFQPTLAAQELLALGTAGPRRDAVLSGLAQVRQSLGPPGAYARAAKAFIEVLDGAGAPQGESRP